MALQSSKDIEVITNSIFQTKNIEGNIAEVGVFNGGSAMIINNIIVSDSINKKLFLCDTFEGLKDSEENEEDCELPNGSYSSNFDEVQSLFSNYDYVKIIKGYFPECATKEIEESKFSFVHLDVDTYLSTLNCLEFFYPRMTKNGIIVSHDYGVISGVTNAINSFFKNKPEIINSEYCAPSECSQVLIIKL